MIDMSTKMTSTTGFHSYLDKEVMHRPGRIVETKTTKHFIVQERDVSYRVYPHFHPYVKQLVQRLLSKSTAGLQAADTEYVHSASLPGSVEVSVGQNAALSVPAGSAFVLLSDVQATVPGPATTLLAAKMQLRFAADTPANMQDGLQLALFDGMVATPLPGSVLTLSQNMPGSLTSDTKITLTSATQVTLLDGTKASVAAGTQVLLLAGTQLTLPSGTEAALLRSKPRPVLYADIFSPGRYNPSGLVQRPYPVKDLDFTSGGAYSVYNWELFFHVPLTIAMHLSKNQHFAEAQSWFHFLFDPTDDSDGPTPARFWKVRPFQTTDVKKIEEILVNLATGADPELRDETVHSIEAWQDAPFRPHVIARYRQQAYMYKTVMAYLDNLVAWGDSLFRQDTGEAIDEAMMLYVLAANILGPRPQPVPQKGSVRPQTYANLRADLKQFGTVMREVESAAPFDLMPFPADTGAGNEQLATVRSLGKALYFCVPRNDILLSYWDTVADRLFKIRNSLNFQGIFRQLALFEPPIDPALLARATAEGLDVGAVINGLNQPLSLVRFQLLVQKATEICQEVKSLGNNVLSAMEKEDGEALAILRAGHERSILELVEHVKYAQLQEASKSREALLKSLALAVQRYTYYERQLGKQADEIEKAIPQLSDLDRDSLDKMKFAMQEGEVGLRPIEVEVTDEGRVHLLQEEKEELDASHSARDWQVRAGVTETAASLSHYIPTFDADFHFWGLGGTIQFGGQHVGPAVSAVARYQQSLGSQDSYDSLHSEKMGRHQRREIDLVFQSNLAAGDIAQIFKQLRAAQIREAVADMELANHRQQMKQAAAIEYFLNEEGANRPDPGTGMQPKKTNKALYTWLKREVKGLYAQCFQFAFEAAKKAERALQHELGDPSLVYVQAGYLAGKEGLLAGEKLYMDIKRMEMAYYDLNQREYEITRHISVLQVDPMSLVRLRATGRCTVQLPEALFDMDGPGHYFRRIKTVAVSIPSVTGPYTSVNCTLTLLKSSIRKTQTAGDRAYAREDAEDDRFNDYFGSVQSIVTSSAQSDSGLFETNLHDERYLPFENSGAISEWQLELPANPSKGDPHQFDYNTISDVILHIRYMARSGGGLLRKGAMDNLRAIAQSGTVRLFSVRHEFPTEWARFKGQTPGADQRFELAVKLRTEHYPFWSQGYLPGSTVTRLDILAQSTKPSLDISDKADKNDASAHKASVTKDVTLGNILSGDATTLLPSGMKPVHAPAPSPDALRLYFDDNKIVDDIWIAITWSSGNA